MEQRLDLTKVSPDGYKALLGVHSYVQNSGLPLGLLELVKMRASQLNGCAFCIAMHVPLARKHGVSDDGARPLFTAPKSGQLWPGRRL